MPDWLIQLLNSPAAMTVIGTGFFVPLLTLIGQIIMRRAPAPPPIAHDVRDLPDHPLLVSSKVHLNEPELAMLQEVFRRVHDIDEDCLPTIDRKLDRLKDQMQLFNDRMDFLLRQKGL